MSLYALPVSVTDLTQLQLGIEFVPNVTEATNEAALINADLGPPYRVLNYANQLLANNISLSQVAMAVDSLMFGVTDNITELTKLATGFLPPQVANANAHGYNPTVYAAEALGLGLAGGNLTSNAFAVNFGSLSVSQFASEVASLTGVNSAAIENFVQNWINFYTANPSATGSLSVTLASYGAAFGDAVGVALLNPTVNGDIALLVSEEQNALIDNGEGLYQVGIPIVLEPPHLPLEVEADTLDPIGPPMGVGPTFDWTGFKTNGSGNYAQFDTFQTVPFTIKNAPSTFTLDTQHFATDFLEIDAAVDREGNSIGNLCTIIVGDSTGGEDFGSVEVFGYSTVHIVDNGAGDSSITHDFSVVPNAVPPAVGPAHLVVSGSGSSFLDLGDISSNAIEQNISVSVNGGTITDVGQKLFLGVTDAETIDASNAPLLGMLAPARLVTGAGVTVLGGASNNQLQGSLGGGVTHVQFSNGSTGVYATIVGADNITGGPGGNDLILGDGGADTITLPPNHSMIDSVRFGDDLLPAGGNVLAITDGSDMAYPGYWGINFPGLTAPTKIASLFAGATGGTSADMTTITGFHAGSGADRLIFDTAAWNGESIIMGTPANGDLVNLDGIHVVHDPHVAPALGQLSAVWTDSGSNTSLKSSDNVLLYAPAGGLPHNAQELAAQLQTAAGAIALPGAIQPGQHEHILVAYDASFKIVVPHLVTNIADVDLVNTSGSAQNSTANLNVYASDMVHLTGVSLGSLTSDNIHFI